MEFRNIEVLLNASYDKVFPVFMKSIQCISEISKSCRIMSRILSKINESKRVTTAAIPCAGIYPTRQPRRIFAMFFLSVPDI